MSIELIQQRLLHYQNQTVLDQENALKEIAQEIALMALSRTDFFQTAAFQGGTCLRILYGLDRFSEDLDFILEKANPQFDWAYYMHTMQEEFKTYGYSLEITAKNKLEKSVRSIFLKADSTGGLLLLKDIRTNRPKMRIKLEIDTNPPMGSEHELKYLDFPLPFSIRTQTLSSLFAGKCHALLCREYVKGRDWYDFSWYISNKTSINFIFLKNAIEQNHPWKELPPITPQWFLDQLKTKILTISWEDAKKDVARFLRPQELKSLEVWSKEFFLFKLDKLAGYWQG